MKYETYSHAKTRIRYHIIFSTKYRKKCLTGIREDLFKYLKSSEKDFKIELMEIDKDHIHFLIKAKPSESIAEIVKKLKQYSTYYIWKNHREYMKKYYWGVEHYLWTRGYFVSTIGEVSEKNILEYIKKQG